MHVPLVQAVTILVVLVTLITLLVESFLPLATTLIEVFLALAMLASLVREPPVLSKPSL